MNPSSRETDLQGRPTSGSSGTAQSSSTGPVLWISDAVSDVQPPQPPFFDHAQEEIPQAVVEPSPDEVRREATQGGMRMGDFLIQQGILQPAEVERIVQYQQQHKLRFGSAAIALRLLTQNQLTWALSRQYQYALASSNPILKQYPIANAPDSTQAEAIRSIRTEILLKLPPDGPHTIAVLSPHRKDRRTYLAASLALAFAQSEFRTLLINADLRNSEAQSLLGAASDSGLSGILSSRSTQQVYQPVPDFPLLYTIDAGPQPPNPSELLREPALRALLVQAGRKFDVIIVNTPPLDEAADAQIIASQVDNSVLLISQDTTTVSEVRKAQALLKGTGSTLLGTVFQESDTPYGKTGRLIKAISKRLPGWKRKQNQ